MMNIPFSLESFLVNETNVENYFETFEYFCTAQGITETRKASTLLATLESAAYDSLKDSLASDSIAQKSHDKLKAPMLQHFGSKYSEIVERYKFRINTSKGITRNCRVCKDIKTPGSKM